jgi:hypothetical protein
MSKPQPQGQGKDNSRRLSLSARGLERASWIEQNDFTVVVGSTTFHCSRFQAAFISPRIAQLLQTNLTVEHFCIDYVWFDSETSQSLLRDLLRIGSVAINDSQVELMLKLYVALQNDELSTQFSEIFLSSKETDRQSCIQRLHLKRDLNVDPSSEFAFIASHFNQISKLSNDTLASVEVGEILKEETLPLETEDWLVLDLIFRGSDFYELFRHVRFEHLSVNGINEFLKHSSYSSVDEDMLIEPILNVL